MKLSKLMEGISIRKCVNFTDAEITSVTADSRRCRAGSLFVALQGSRCNGTDFISDAYRRGARVFMVEEECTNLPNTTVIYSDNARKTLAELCSKLSGNPEKKLLFVGITGTKGKTTTAFLTSKILERLGIKNIFVGTLGVIGKSSFETLNTTPDPTVLFPLFKNAVRDGVKVVVLEVSSQALKDFRVWGISFDCVAFTGLGKDHIGEFEHPNFCDYITCKRSLFNSYGAKRAVINFDDPYASYISSGVPKVTTCGFTKGSNLMISDFYDTSNGANFLVGNTRVYSSLAGEYNARNVALSLAISREVSGASVSDTARFITSLKVPGRFDLRVVRNRNVIIDYAHNKDSLKEIVTLAKRLFSGRVICVFGSVGGRSFSRRKELAEAAEKYSDFSVITSDNPGYEFPLSICAEIYGAFKDKSRAKIIVSRREAILYAIGIANIEDVVLVLGKGHETYINMGENKVRFSDGEFIEKLEKGL